MCPWTQVFILVAHPPLPWKRLELLVSTEFPVFFLFPNVINDYIFWRLADASAIAWWESIVAAGKKKEKEKGRQKNGGPQENLPGVFALPCQLFAENVATWKAFHPPVYTCSGLRRGYDPLGCHRGRKNSAASMTAHWRANAYVWRLAYEANYFS